MKLKGILVSQLKDFKDNFSLGEVWNKINNFLYECSPEKMLYSEKEAKLYTVLDLCFREGTEEELKVSLTEEGWLDIEPFERVRLEYVSQDRIKSITKAIELSPVHENTQKAFIAIISLYELAERELDEKEFIIHFLKEQFGSGIDTQSSHPSENKSNTSDRLVLEFESNDIPYKLRQYSFRKDIELEIKTKRLVNVSKSVYGCVTILVLGKDDCILNTLQLKPGESIYANFIGEELIEVLPTISCRELHYIYRTKDSNGDDTLARFTFENELSILYPSKELQGITQFLATDDKGFVGIADGRLITYTSTKIELEDLREEEKPVTVYLRGTSYLILTNRGTIYSNRNFNHRGVISIYFDDYYNAYAITAEGKVVSDNPKFVPKNHYEDIVAIYANNATVALKTFQSELICLDCITGEQNTVKNSQIVNARVSQGQIYKLEDGNICLYNSNKTLLANLMEFDMNDEYIVGKAEEYIYCLELSSMGQLRPVKFK